MIDALPRKRAGTRLRGCKPVVIPRICKRASFLLLLDAMRPSRGFTLVELMTVVAIVGTLAGLSAVALSRLKSRGNFASNATIVCSGVLVCT